MGNRDTNLVFDNDIIFEVSRLLLSKSLLQSCAANGFNKLTITANYDNYGFSVRTENLKEEYQDILSIEVLEVENNWLRVIVFDMRFDYINGMCGDWHVRDISDIDEIDISSKALQSLFKKL